MARVRDALAGVTTAVAAVPAAMASAVLAGLNPARGLYPVMAGMPAAD